MKSVRVSKGGKKVHLLPMHSTHTLCGYRATGEYRKRTEPEGTVTCEWCIESFIDLRNAPGIVAGIPLANGDVKVVAG